MPLVVMLGTPGSLADSRSQASGTFEQNNHVVINNEGTNGQIGPQALKAVYDVARKAAMDVVTGQMLMVVCSPEVDDENLPLESETRYGCGFGPFRQEGALW
ncbi:hypothetical protein ACLB1E_22185 [Escherichia coli]